MRAIRLSLPVLLCLGGAATAQQAAHLIYPVQPAPTTIAASATWNSGILISGGSPKVAAGVTSTQAGAITITRYLDTAGTVTIDTHTAPLTANNFASLVLVDNVPFGSFMVQISNTGGSAATLTNFSAAIVSGS